MKIKLSYPILVMRMFKYVTIDEIELRRPTLADMKGLDFNDTTKSQEAFKMMIQRISDVPVKDLEKIDMADWVTISNTFNQMTGVRK